MHSTAVDPYLFPARGRKPDPVPSCFQDEPVVDPYLFPARGRKPQNFFWDLPLRIYVDPYLFPARGRKRFQPLTDVIVGDTLIPTFSPQGDGNF